MKNHSLVGAIFAFALTMALVAGLHADTAKAGWGDDEAAALAKAKADKKMVLLDFTGSDWCAVCLRMNRDVFDTPEFKDYARDNLELVEVDFPQAKALPLETVKQNAELLNRYHVEALPVYVLLDGKGTLVKVLEGYQPGGPTAFVETLKKLKG